MKLPAIALVAALACAPAAQAEPADDPGTVKATAAAVAYWQARGLEAPCPPTFEWLDEVPAGWDPQGGAFTRRNSCEGFLIRPALQLWTWQDFCRAIVHEVGHMVGLGHDSPLLGHGITFDGSYVHGCDPRQRLRDRGTRRDKTRRLRLVRPRGAV